MDKRIAFLLKATNVKKTKWEGATKLFWMSLWTENLQLSNLNKDIFSMFKQTDILKHTEPIDM